MKNILFFVVIFICASFSYGFLPGINRNSISRVSSELAVVSRREAVTVLSSAIGVTGVLSFQPNVSLAADKDKPVIWKSGKAPIVPGQKPKDSNDVKGTRKDPDFLRSIATCKNQCENTLGSDGYAKTKEECLSDCQVSIIQLPCFDIDQGIFIYLHNSLYQGYMLYYLRTVYFWNSSPGVDQSCDQKTTNLCVYKV